MMGDDKIKDVEGLTKAELIDLFKFLYKEYQHPPAIQETKLPIEQLYPVCEAVSNALVKMIDQSVSDLSSTTETPEDLSEDKQS